jgi:hypothetical protein
MDTERSLKYALLDLRCYLIYLRHKAKEVLKSDESPTYIVCFLEGIAGKSGINADINLAEQQIIKLEEVLRSLATLDHFEKMHKTTYKHLAKSISSETVEDMRDSIRDKIDDMTDARDAVHRSGEITPALSPDEAAAYIGKLKLNDTIPDAGRGQLCPAVRPGLDGSKHVHQSPANLTGG